MDLDTFFFLLKDLVLTSALSLWDYLKLNLMEHYLYVAMVAATLLLLPFIMDRIMARLDINRRNKTLGAWRRKIRLTHKFAETLAYRSKPRG
ncbi:hypothetical protein [Aeromonas hydrophila]|uniref:hypothetical protein n=1 Tax=Aeromonas hydrophila TaxID=644 RepID=UPI00224D8E0C|nr:hypothetical protein [Aeromonas hydrophila]MCX4116353.1 hypothetical protein [Aeromonas hydrophila]